ncbi:E3 ubiquitin/ISG15 ligase TRIM25 isoform X2 [Sinocyclocheilus anshuiensis]|uniref:E3 ubiquitin/ISG15 ligase TRIM25 isoform X2 n=1 Tax=Sinocyclocheilus anshuiensis TaxID=1608454 RepID=UPI0007B9FA80|nr:PREDICTED: E3 ubiquitin/ISG15 ligase TRIM25-like isoform X2 [Sinocyclocheilus anshuiensis]
MAENMSLLGLEDELTCSICLCLFENPVSLICGHSFCANCLEATWNDRISSLSCPHCRMVFPSKPELKKNTVLNAVLDAYRIKAGVSEPVKEHFEVKKKDPDAIKCDNCMEAKAVKTCLTCMASYCEDHVRPHRENAIFRAHQLTDPLPDLMERLCSNHGKLMEFYCNQHQRCICSTCLQDMHKGCDFITADERRFKQKTDLTDKLNILEVKTDKNQQVITQMKEQQIKLKDLAATRKRVLESEYRQLREMIDRDEKEAMLAIDKEQEKGQSKLVSLIKKFNENIEKMSRTKSEINILLDQSQSLEFLKASVDLPSVVNVEPYNPRMNVESKEVIAYHSSAVALKEWVTKLMEQPLENRISVLKPGLGNQFPGIPSEIPALLPNPRDMCLGNQFPGIPSEIPALLPNPRDMCLGNQFPGIPSEIPALLPNPRDMWMQKAPIAWYDPSAHLSCGPKAKASGTKQKNSSKTAKDQKDHKERKDQKPNRSRNPSKGANPVFSKSMENLLDITVKTVDIPDINPPAISPAVLNFVKRSDLLKYGTILNFDVRTAHKRISLSENNTKATVSDDPAHYTDIPLRFSVCSQVLCTKGFSQGRHYWEIKMSSNNFCGLGLAYGRIDRKGPSSRLGRNADSWCVEWFNVKLSAWHNSIETVLQNPNPSRVGILLDCDQRSATFYTVQDRAYPFHTFVFPFTEAVYPAFWIFSNGSSVSLCKLSN